MALSLGLPPPAVNWHRVFVEPGLSSLKFIKNLNNIGYCFSTKKKSFLVKIMKAFQRHYRPELINGRADKECLIIAQNLLKKS